MRLRRVRHVYTMGIPKLCHCMAWRRPVPAKRMRRIRPNRAGRISAMDLRWICDGSATDLGWIWDGSATDLRWICDGSAMDLRRICDGSAMGPPRACRGYAGRWYATERAPRPYLRFAMDVPDICCASAPYLLRVCYICAGYVLCMPGMPRDAPRVRNGHALGAAWVCRAVCPECAMNVPRVRLACGTGPPRMCYGCAYGRAAKGLRMRFGHAIYVRVTVA